MVNCPFGRPDKFPINEKLSLIRILTAYQILLIGTIPATWTALMGLLADY